ncbi:hypothetical protein AMQ83_01840, partial [Paenibacillus riograndensis]
FARSLVFHDRISYRLAGGVVPMDPLGWLDTLSLRDVGVFNRAGTYDAINRREATGVLASLLREAVADVTMLWGNQGHRLSSAEAEAARDWLKQQSNFR